ncbi:DUF262 domain-containing protein [Planococcus lenghuensis]|uniref:GmrSD restriction endonucleases N-terminal domain-containing protein n=1 Tax=Planococcus lenghuensis TaxID=2213202 RepID=A0A1Q2KW29_9BACL|nr:DUF262 domain-containing protein [Planococcus lenghuensis]AQQ52324.1 hypothetical protein B0X71_03835 [Planococcus lenghuensis]
MSGQYESKYTSNQYTFSQLSGRVKVPTFQRRLVWSTAQRHEFIETLNMGYPFGSVLIYKYESRDEVTLIDGLQRFSTILDYQKHPENYIATEGFEEKLLKIISSRLSDSDKKDVKALRKIKKQLNVHVKETLSNKDRKSTFLSNAIKSDDLLKGYYDSTMVEEIIELQDLIEETKENFLKVDQILIPTIEFLGDVSELAKVFENLNKGGKKLTKYQVFAAQWYNDVIELNDKKYNSLVLEEVIKRYETLNKNREIKIEKFSSEKMREERSINLSEFCYALGKIIINSSPVFYSDRNSSQVEDLADELGYSTLGVILGIDNRRLYTIQNQIYIINSPDFIEDLVGKIIFIYGQINTHFEKYLSRPHTEKKYENKKISNFKFLSYFADLWSGNFQIADGTVKGSTNGASAKFSNTLKNFIYFYIFDALRGNWGNAGDARLNSFYLNSKTYEIKLSKDSLEDELNNWWEERTVFGSINFDDMSKLLYTVLQSFYKDRYVQGRDYEYEHIIVKKKVEDKYKELNIPAGTLGNMMFLEKSWNRRKKDINLYDAELETGQLTQEFIDNNLYPTQSNIVVAEKDLSNNNAAMANRLIKERGKSLIDLLLFELYK